ncbi:MAG TPA: type I-E CRISPR-associated protein Cas5/CasD [Candidatus Hydrogenedentes bacterium]|nr:type I-E CRISPR-associated protein Cas5/CasD [Candidatus Hydrogenedentota bacterium]HPG65204.1 type I-E CRISPR-associated protein Cas5/CasD [Candidatus Hydrogenedentota bacterium]
MSPNTLFLRIEGPLQAWGDQESKFVVRRTAEAPTKSGLIGLFCAALGMSRAQAGVGWLPKLTRLRMAIRIDRPGIRWWDYHTVGAGMQMRIAEADGKTKPGAMLTRREYLCDASFLVALQGDPALIAELEAAVRSPAWPAYLGRKCCPPSRPLLEDPSGTFPDLVTALQSVPWRRRLDGDMVPKTLDCLIEWTASAEEPEAPDDALVWYDVPLTFDPPSHAARFVVRRTLEVGESGQVEIAAEPTQRHTPSPPRPRADYGNTEYRKRREERLAADHHVCVFCKCRATTVQHVTYRHAGGDERTNELRSLCRLCHDAVTMIEYGMGMGLDRINPEEPRWRDRIMKKRDEIVEFRSLETRRRKLAAEEVE